MTDYYAILGVSRDASADEIKRAYRRLARELHPDVNPDPASQERFKEVTAAYEVLSDPQKRQMFDMGADPLGGASGFGGFSTGFDFGDIMDAFFGGQGQRGPRTRTRRGQDALIRVQIDLPTAIFGGSQELAIDTATACGSCNGAGTSPGSEVLTCGMCRGRGEIQQVQRSFLGQVMTSRPCPQCRGFGTTIPHPCPECSGEGRVRTRRTLTIAIPPGVDTGTRIKLTGEGEVGQNGGGAGDLYVEVLVSEHPVFTREGDALHCTLHVPMTVAALGRTVTIQSLDGDEVLDVRAGTQPGDVLILRGKGAPRLRGSGRGDLNVHLAVEIPRKMDDTQSGLLRQLSDLRPEDAPRLAGLDPETNGGLFSRLRGAFTQR